MSFLDELKKLTRPYDEDEDEYLDDAERIDAPEPEAPKANPFSGFGSSEPAPAQPAAAPTRPLRPKEGKVVNLGSAGSQMQVVLVKPERFEDAPSIGDHLCQKKTVVLNLESASKDVSKRLIDFLSGVAYANRGQIKRVANSTFIITPANVDVTGDLVMDELEHGSLYL